MAQDMISAEFINYQLDVYTGATCWRGQVSYASARRLTDLMNDMNQNYIELERSTLVTWEDQSPREMNFFDEIAVSKKNAIVVVCHGCPVDAPANTPERVAKIARRVTIYAPPLIIAGNIHTLNGERAIKALEFAKRNFVPLTFACVTRMDGKPPLSVRRGLALVNRDAIVAVQSMPDAPEERDPQAIPIRNPRLIAVAAPVDNRTSV